MSWVLLLLQLKVSSRRMLEFISHVIQCHSNSWLHLGKAEHPVSALVDGLPFLGSEPILQNLVI